MSDMPLPPELAAVWGANPDLRYRGNNEWSSACPKCNPMGRGGHNPSDRFRMFSEGGPARAWCRGCDVKYLAKQFSDAKITDEDRKAARAKYVAWLEEENKKLRDKIKWLQEQEFWQRWHENMSVDAKDLWRDAGINDALIDVHKLGYTMERYQPYGGALTMPYIHQNKIQTLQFRLMITPDEGDKYRFEKGTKPNWFYPWPYDEIGSVVLVTEGAKKAMVLWQTIAQADKFTYRGSDITIIASPSKYVPNHMIESLDKADLVLWLLDPDAYDRETEKARTALERNAIKVGVEKCRHIRTSAKIDDMIMEHGIEHGWVQSAVEQASPIILKDASRKPTTRYL